ncbi:hypothetical protein GCM10027562_02010 [Arthrobacter pigmenti]
MLYSAVDILALPHRPAAPPGGRGATYSLDPIEEVRQHLEVRGREIMAGAMPYYRFQRFGRLVTNMPEALLRMEEGL